ncbi:cell division ATP-binding protein FtsE [Frateuria aurantia]|uniref:Cell division ATP-binding protein FtsE n=1 Tax=Frateuria aurantia (strain ATCC 33424 / DSM 6220 / KCTC 2777 / LMG 1558 / NBRC 3245 / NCIMB 13370) TaxID=767434 RepID=H8KZW3_FRAAD|nr:cell division ATP-binding protein FtsE [Frateuria aurantia]AFC85244.1 cell division ATP-binding protein FtsE [Frateuria aurantia DSM 6220]
MIRFEQVSKRYDEGHTALAEVSFEVAAGEMVFVTGHSGAGKSTLLRMLALAERPTAGRVWLNQTDLAAARASQVAPLRRRIGMVFQDHRLLTDRSVFANVELPLMIGDHSRRQRRQRVMDALTKVGLQAYAEQLPSTLSTGEQQRVGIARAIVARPELLIADEPTGNLDPQLAMEIMGLFTEFEQLGTTVLIASHDLSLIKRLHRRVIVLDHGQLVADVAAREVL